MKNESEITNNGKVLRVEHTLKGCHRDSISSLSFCPTENVLVNRHARNGSHKERSSQLASASLDGTITLWNFFCNSDRANTDPVRPLKLVGHTGPIHCVRYSPTGSLLASSSSDKTVRIWIPNADGGSVVLKGHTGPVRCVAFGNTSSCTYNGHCIYQESTTPAMTSSLLITASDDKTAKIWSLPSKRFLCSFSGHTNYVRTATFSPDACLAATGSDDKTMKLWDLQRGNDRSASCLTTFYDYGAQVNDVQFHPSGTCLVSGSADHKIRLYDIRSDKLIQLFSTTSCTQSNATTSHDDAGGVSSLSFHPNGNYLLSSSSTGSSSYSDTSTSENNIHMWDLREGRLLHSMPGTHTTPNNKCDHRQRFSSSTTTSGCAAFSFDGTRFATGGVDNRILVWNSTQLCKQIFATEQSNVNVAPSRPCDARNVAPSSHAVRQPFVNINSNNRPASAPITKTQSKWATATTSTEFIGSDDNYCKGSPSISSFEENLIKVGRAPLNLLSTVHFQADPNETLAKATERIAMQLDLITKTLSLLDTRLAAQESNVEQIMASLNLSRNDEPTYRST